MSDTEFEQLWRESKQQILKTIAQRLGWEDAEDVASKVWLKLYRRKHTFRGGSAIAWAHACAGTAVIDHVRCERRRGRNGRHQYLVLSLNAHPEELDGEEEWMEILGKEMDFEYELDVAETERSLRRIWAKIEANL